ncbi:MAG TPA: sulfur oxidation c-type cytochrome SoxA [Gammaproteobacteria bacterium]|nr:sulfur oxidation c-type cytochrome SoxA [Gammaproteobacteria bacterium]
MKKVICCMAVALSIAIPMGAAQASPADDLKAFQNYFKKKFPNVPKSDFVNGVYALDKASREQWEAIEEFPPYEIDIDKGEEMWNKAFANGKTYASCLGDDASKVKAKYPHFDTKKGEVVTLEGDINACRVSNGEKPLGWKKGKIAALSAYLAYQARGQKIDVKIPDDPKALAAYERGKHHFYAKRGQLNMACADCHVYYAGSRIRADILSPALGHVSHFPVYRSKWGGLGTLHRRYGGCNKQVRAKPFKAQSAEYKALEYFHTYMSNGLEFNGPGARK